MSIFNKAKMQSAYLKCGIQGFAGSGKSFSGCMAAIGLHEYIKSNKPIYFFDTESGSDYLQKYFELKEITLMIAKTRSFVDLLNGTDEAEKVSDILIIDSITHFWNELVEAYGDKKGKKRLTLKDWAQIKPEWRQFTNRYLTSKLHIFMLGRAGWDFEEIEDEEGIKELTKTGTKMKVEVDLGYEPSLALEMERVRNSMGQIGSSFNYRCWVLKDRFNLINGDFSTFKASKDEELVLGAENPVFGFILPHIKALNLGGEHKLIEEGGKTGEMFNTDNSVTELIKKKNIALEEIKDHIILLFPGRDSESTKSKLNFLKDMFGSTSWTAIENMNFDSVIKAREKILTINPEEIGKK